MKTIKLSAPKYLNYINLIRTNSITDLSFLQLPTIFMKLKQLKTIAFNFKKFNIFLLINLTIEMRNLLKRRL